MPEPASLALFVSASLLLLVLPGPAVLYIVARAIDQGRSAGIVSTLGIATGTLFHIGAAAFGVSAVLVRSALAFQLMKYLGAAYLIYLGVRRLLVAEEETSPRAAGTEPRRRLFVQGVLVNLLNPKTALFFFAFLPQFVDIGRGQVAAQIFLLGGIFVSLGLVSDSLWALLAGTLGGWLRRHHGFLRAQRWVGGGVCIALGVSTALSGSGRK